MSVKPDRQGSRLEQRKSTHQKARAASKEALYSYVGTPDYVAPEVQY